MTSTAPARSAPYADASPFTDVDALLGSLLDPGAFRPVQVLDVEITEGLRRVRARAGGRHEYRLALAVVRLHAQPLGLAVLELDVDEPEPAWTRAVWGAVGPAIESHLVDDARTGMRCNPDPDLWNGWTDAHPPCLLPRRAATEAAPAVTVVVASRERPELLARCLGSLMEMSYPDFDVVVVDNAPESNRTYEVVTSFDAGSRRVRYAREDRRGLAAAHNRALTDVRGQIIAFTDDDVVVDRYWLAELVAPFVADARIAASTGLILPAELETESQLLLEATGRYIKGYEPRHFDRNGHRPDDPLFPFTAGTLGAGANMAFAADYLRAVGGFDAALGTGTLARGGDDLAALFGVVASGRSLAYRPGAIVWHHHRRDAASLPRQTYDYAVGLGAYLTSAVVHHPKELGGLLRRLPGGVSLLRSRDARRAAEHWSPSLERIAHRGLLVGPFAYARSRWHAARRTPLVSEPRPADS